MTNFDFLTREPEFAVFAEPAVTAERIYAIDPAACAFNCRRSMELAVKWMYSVDRELEPPYQDSLVSLMSDGAFRDIVGPDLWRRMDYIRKLGNAAAHSGKKITPEQAAVGYDYTAPLVMLAGLGDLYSRPDDKGYFLAPKDFNTSTYVSELMERLRSGSWPAATADDVFQGLEWTLRRRSDIGGRPTDICEVSCLDFPGEVYRKAFVETTARRSEEMQKKVELI